MMIGRLNILPRGTTRVKWTRECLSLLSYKHSRIHIRWTMAWSTGDYIGLQSTGNLDEMSAYTTATHWSYSSYHGQLEGIPPRGCLQNTTERFVNDNSHEEILQRPVKPIQHLGTYLWRHLSRIFICNISSFSLSHLPPYIKCSSFSQFLTQWSSWQLRV